MSVKLLLILVLIQINPFQSKRQGSVDVLIRISDHGSAEIDSLFASNDETLDGLLEILRYVYLNNIAYRFQAYKVVGDTVKKNLGYLFAQREYTHAYYHWTTDEIVQVRLVDFENDEEGPVILLKQVGSTSIMEITEKGDLE